MLTQEQQDALSGSGAYRPSLPPPSGSTFRPLPGEMGRPGSYMPTAPVQSSPGSMANIDEFLFIALLGLLG